MKVRTVVPKSWQRDHTLFAGLLGVAWILFMYIHWFLVSHGYGGIGLLLAGMMIATAAAMWVMCRSITGKD